MTPNRTTLIIDGIDHYMGAEIARFGRAMGHRIIGLLDGPLPDPEHFAHPWMHGVIWLTDPDALSDPYFVDHPKAFILTRHSLFDGHRGRFRSTHIDRLRSLLALADQWPRTAHLVFRSTVAQPLLPRAYTDTLQAAESLLQPFAPHLTIMRTPLLYGPDRPDSLLAFTLSQALNRLPFARSLIPSPLPVETAALAALRAALEPDPPTLLTPDDIASYGDVMIPS